MRRASLDVVAPTCTKMEVTVPAAASQSAMVSGMRSPCSSGRKMMKFPA